MSVQSVAQRIPSTMSGEWLKDASTAEFRCNSDLAVFGLDCVMDAGQRKYCQFNVFREAGEGLGVSGTDKRRELSRRSDLDVIDEPHTAQPRGCEYDQRVTR